ncbi:MAG: hypothetical protein AAGJ86_10075, partial [Pseudomonadota bacterium]
MANKQSRLHVPSAPARPGDKPDFSYLTLAPAGSVGRPDINVRVADTQTLAPPEHFTQAFRQKRTLRYGENPHQTAAFYEPAGASPSFLAAAE